ncbi:hypothetical protein HDU98_006610 [Podochytrium sp. JEL0797]|nr:hypothetical protein HDU98_006610 [Podochytrium sp. JEL0797]
MIQSIHPIRLNMPLIKQKLRDHIQSEKSTSEAKFLLEHPRQVLEAFTPRTLKTFESLVLQKYYKNGTITGFKGKQDLQTMKLKSIAKHEIDEIREDAEETEDNLTKLKNHLHECRANVSQHTAECSHLIKQIIHVVDTDLPKIETHSGNPKQAYPTIETSLKDPLNFTLPTAPHLIQNRRFRNLCHAYTQSSGIARDSIAAIPFLEAEIVPVEHHLTVLQIQLDRLRGLSEDIFEKRKRQEIEAHEEQEEKKMMIVKKLLDIEECERKEYNDRKSEQEMHNALVNLAPRALAAFPLNKNLGEAKKPKFSREKSLSPETMDIEKVLNVPIDIKPSNKPRLALPPPKHQPNRLNSETSQTTITHPFSADPSNLVFKDYEPEIVYSKTIKITNTSCRVNTFRMLPLSVELATFFEVNAPTPGRMSAGMDYEISVIFRPPAGYNQDIEDGIVEFAAEHGGKFDIKLGCSSKKCNPRIASVSGPGLMAERPGSINAQISSSEKERMCQVITPTEVCINFGSCVQGGVATRTIEIHNDGAVSTEVEIFKNFQEEPSGPFYLVKKVGIFKIAGYASLDVGFTFQPPRRASEGDEGTSAVYILKFSASGVPPITLNCKGQILHSPIRISRNMVDFGIGVVDSIYRDSVIITNHSNVAIKYWVEIEGMTLRSSKPNTTSKAHRVTVTSDKTKNMDFGSDICTDGLNSECGEMDGLMALNFFSEEDLFDEAADQESSEPSETEAPVDLSAPGNGGQALLGVTSKTTADSNAMLVPKSTSRRASAANLPATRAQSYTQHEDQQNFSIRPIKRSSRNPAAMSKRTDNLEVEVQNMGELEISPKLAIIQPFETSTISFKTKPSRSGHILLKNGENPWSVHVQIKYMNQNVETPISLALEGRVTTSDISFSIPSKTGESGGSRLLFNECTLSEAKQIPIKITNHSLIPQKVRFTSSDPSITVVFKQNVDVEGSVPIEPLSHQIRMVHFEPSDSGSVKARLCCHSVWNRNFEMKCTGTGVKTLLKFEHSELRLGALGVGSSKSTTLRILCHGSKTTSFGSSLNLSKITSVVKQTWSSNNPATKARTETAKEGTNDEDTVKFEFGHPKIIGIYSRSKLDNLYKEISCANNEASRSICAEAAEAVSRTDPTLLRAFRPLDSKPASTPEFNPKECPPQSLFSPGLPSHSNPRILVPAEVESLADSQSEKLSCLSFEDSAMHLVSLYPKNGVLGPGDQLEVKVKVAVQSLSNLVVHKTIVERLRVAEDEKAKHAEELLASIAASEQLVSEEKAKLTPEKKEEKGKGAKEKSSTKAEIAAALEAFSQSQIAVPVEPIVYAAYIHPQSANPTQPNAWDSPIRSNLYDHLDDTCITVLVPCKIQRTLPLRVAKHEQEIRQLEEMLHLTDSRSKKSKSSTEVIYLRVVVPIVAPDLLLLEPESGTIDFGTIPLHKTEIRPFVIFNQSSSAVDLSTYEPFDTDSPFKLVTDLKKRALDPQSRLTAHISFTPTHKLSYTSEFDIFSSTSQVHVNLLGQGVVPTISVDPANTDLFLGDVVVGDASYQTFKVTNTSYHALTCHIRLSGTNGRNTSGTVNFNKANAFSVAPWHARIEPNVSQEFTIKFTPDRESDLFFDTVTVDPWGAPSTTEFQVHGRCWDTSSVLTRYDRPSPHLQEHGHAHKPSLELEYAQKMYYGEFPRPPPISQTREDDDLDTSESGGGVFSSNLSISGANAVLKQPSESKSRSGSTTKLNVDSKKKGGVSVGGSGTKEKADAAGKFDTEEVVADVLKFTSRVESRYVHLTCPWKRHEETGKWFVDPKEIVIASIKSAAFVKPETKRPPHTEYSIEMWDGSFEYSESKRGFVVLPAVKRESIVRFSVDNPKGVVEFGSANALAVRLINPAQEFANTITALKKSVFNGKSEKGEEAVATSSVAFFDAPIQVESYFKVTLKGGFRYTEPKGLVSAGESRMWFVKVRTNK